MIRLIIFDWKRTLYDPNTQKLIDGTTQLLEYIKKKNIPMILIGKGGDDMQQEVNRLGVGKFFLKIIFAEGEKDPNIFAPHISEDHPANTLFIGDRILSELSIGNRLGATTVWVQQGKFKAELPENREQEPDYIVSSLPKCLSLLKKI